MAYINRIINYNEIAETANKLSDINMLSRKLDLHSEYRIMENYLVLLIVIHPYIAIAML